MNVEMSIKKSLGVPSFLHLYEIKDGQLHLLFEPKPYYTRNQLTKAEHIQKPAAMR